MSDAPTGIRRSTRAGSASPPPSPPSSSRWCSSPAAVAVGRAGRRVRARRVRRACASPRTPCSSACSSRRGSARRTAREDAAPVRFSQAVGFVFAAVGAARLPHRHHRARHRRPPRSRWPPPSSTRPSASAWAARCTRLIARLRTTSTTGSLRMSRQDVLVTADWAEKNLGTEGSSSSRSTRTPPPTTAGTSPAPSRSTGPPSCRTRCAATSSTRSSSSSCCRPRASATTTPSSSTAATTTGSPPTRTGSSSSTATATSSCSTAAARSGSSTAAPLTTEVADRPASHLHRAGRRHVDPRVPRRGRRRDRHRRTSSTCARPTSSPARSSRPAHLPQEQSQRPGHIPGAINIPWSKAANEDGTFKSDDELAKLYGESGFDERARRPSPTAASASAARTRGSCCTSCSATATSRTTTAAGPSTARSSACRSSWGRGSRPDVRRT